MPIVVDPDLQAYIDPLTPDELAALERSLLAEGCRDALVLWGDVLVDGHNRHGLCVKHGLPFQTVQNPRFRTREDVHLWMIDQHLGRRSVSDFQRGLLALRKKEILAARAVGPAVAPGEAAVDDPERSVPPAPVAPPLQTREDIARAARVSSGQMAMIEKVSRQAAPEVVAAVRSGAISLNAAAAVATLPAEEQVAAAAAGGNELRQAARRVREARRRPVQRQEAAEGPAGDMGATEVPAEHDTLDALRRRIAALEAENADLRRRLAAAGGG